MKFGMLVNTQNPPDGKNIPRLYQEVLVEAELAEKVGFDSVFVPEHHMMPDGYLPSPPTLLAAIASRTQRIRLGSSILQLPEWHPINVAEAWAVLDNISNGRAILGCGLGLVEAEFRLFGKKVSDAAAMFNEQIEILKRAWSGGTFSFRGKFWELSDVHITPLCVQKPRVPIWVGSMSESALKRAGRIGDGWISDPLHHINVMKSWAEIYRAAAREHSNKAEVVLIRDCWVADTRDEVEHVWWPGLRAMHLFYKNLGFFESGRFNTEWEPWVRTVTDDQWTFDRVAPNRVIAGTPAQVIEELQRYREEVACEYIICYFRHPSGPNHDYTMRCIRDWGEKVISKF